MKSKDQILLEQAYMSIREGMFDKAKEFINKNVIQYDKNAPGGSNAPGGEEYEANKAAARKEEVEKENKAYREKEAQTNSQAVATAMKQTPEDVKAAAPYAQFVSKVLSYLSSDHRQNMDDRGRGRQVPNPNTSMQSLESFIYQVFERGGQGTASSLHAPRNLNELLFNSSMQNVGGKEMGVRKFDPTKPLVKALFAEYNKVF